MKPQKKKLCISVLLDQLFKTVDDVDDAKRGSTSLVRSRVPIPQEDFFLRRTNHWRRSRNEWWKESYYYRSTFRKVDSCEDWPAKETVRRGTNSPSKEVKDEEKTIPCNSTPMTVDIALSTTFLTSSKAVDPKQLRPVLGVERSTSTREKVDDSIQTDGEDRSVVKNNVEVGVYLSSAEYSMRNSIINNIITNKKSFLATKTIKSTNLALWNNKDTQSDPIVRFKPKEKHSESKGIELSENLKQDEKLEEVFLSKSSRKRQPYVNNQLLAKESGRGSRMIHSRVSSEMKIMQHRIDTVVRKRSRVTNSNSHASVDCIRTKKSLESTTKANIQVFLHSTMSLPREIKLLDQINNWMIPFEVENTFPDGTTIDKSLNLFRENCCPEADMNKFRIETECEISRVHTPTPGTGTSVKPVNPIQDASEKSKKSPLRETQTEVVKKVPTKMKTDSEDNLHLGQMIMQAIGPQIVQEAQQLSMREEMPRQDAHPPNVEPHSCDVTVQWELEIELQSRSSGKVTGTKHLAKKNPSRGVQERKSNTHVILLHLVKSHNRTMTDSNRQQPCGSEIEECYFKDETMQKMYRGNVPRQLLLATERRLKEISR